ncbi:YidB family protein [Methylotenera sp. L2L1]|uniref:YidB family protein n=1 Tax=Methylotenera sp. L2L1 TaxID=1502770 RepID=UPI00056AE604|nr:YidB family protein [Methylotenera sp. L2L1]
MGLFDSLAGAVLSNIGGDKGTMVQIAMDLFKQNGGLEGVLAKFNEAGLAEQAASWISKGDNLPISAEQVIEVLGRDSIAGIAEKLTMSPSDISEKIAEYLPQAIDKMTPNGEVDGNSGNLLTAVMGMLK